MNDQNEEYRGFYENLYKSTPKLNIYSYFKQYSKYLNTLPKTDRSIQSYMNVAVNDEKMKLLSEYCNIDKLTVPGEIEKRTTHRITWRKEVFENEQVPSDVELKTISEAKIRSKIKKESKRFKYSSETPVHYDKMHGVKELCAVACKDILVFVRIYGPYKTSTSSRLGKKSGRISLDNVVALRGEQTLADLRDKITCLSDYATLKDISTNPFEERNTPSAKDIYPSCFFYIEGTFYNDSRFVNSTDNSKVIRDWANEHNHGPFKVALMEDTRIDSLSVRFGFPWVYQHQGRCEHIIVFSDARLFGYDDELSLLVYPRITKTRHQSVRYCMMCGIYSAGWITMENDRLPHNPCYFCNRCFKSYNYINGQKLGNFKAYPYPSDKELLKIISDAPITRHNKTQLSKK